jgi:hypothetical protein
MMKLTTSLMPSLRIITVASLVPFLLLPILNDMGIFSCFANEIPYPGDPCYMYDPEFPEIGRIACYDQTGQKICCNESPVDDGDGSTYGDGDSGLDDATLGAVVAGFVAAAAAIGVAVSKGSLGKASTKGTKMDSTTKSPVQYTAETAEKYLKKPPYRGMGTYHWEPATPPPQSEASPSVMKPEDFDLRSIEGVGITNPPSSNPPPRNVIYGRTQNSVNLRWEPPTEHDTSTGNVLQGYDVYYQERTQMSTDWVTRHIAVPNTQTGIIIQNPPVQSQNFGVRVVYKTPDGSIFYSEGIQGTPTGG